MKEHEPPTKHINEGDSLSHLRDMLLFHANARADIMKDLKVIIMSCESYEFDNKILGHGGSSSTSQALLVIKEIKSLATNAYKKGIPQRRG